MTKWYDRSRPTTAGPRRRTVLAGGVAGTVAAALGIGGSAQARHGATPAQAPRGASSPKALPLGFAPNIVFLLTDDGPRNSYGVAENAFPVVANRYMGHWLSYPNGSCNDPMCAPGRASTLSGLVSQHHQVLDNNTGNKLDLDATWLVALQNAGYRCGGYGKLINGWGYDFGSNKQVPPGFDDFHMLVSAPGYFDYVLNDNGTPTRYRSRDSDRRNTDYLTDVNRYQILDFINENQRRHPDRPWAVYWAPNAPHRDERETAVPPERYAHAKVPLIDPPNFNAGPQARMPWLAEAQAATPLDAPANHREHLMAMRALMAVDEGLKAIIDQLTSLGILENTVIVVATDNSHIYGAHGLQDKGTSFEESLNFLLRVRYPGAPDGEERLQAVSNIDIAPFLCELGGATMPGAVDGESFVSTLLKRNAAFREAAPICHAADGLGTPAFDGLRFADRKVVVGRENGSAADQQWMHDLIADPWELDARRPARRDLRKLQAMLDSF